MLFFFLSLLLPPSSTRTDSRVPYTTLFPLRRSGPGLAGAALRRSGGRRECELRILPPQVGEDGGAAMVRHPDADAARPEIRVRHLWRGRVDAGADAQQDRQSVVSGKRVSVRLDLGGRRNIKKKK